MHGANLCHLGKEPGSDQHIINNCYVGSFADYGKSALSITGMPTTQARKAGSPEGTTIPTMVVD